MNKALGIINTIHLGYKRITDNFFSRKIFSHKGISVAVFLISFFCLYSYLGFFKFIKNRPSSIHISAQCQRASIALNYYKTDMNFFKPKIQRYVKGEGITGVEFPIIYYTAAILYKMFGFNEVFLRVISWILVAIGLFYFYLFTNRFLRNPVLSVLLILAASLSPVFLFYTPNFMPDAPSVGLQLMSWYFLYDHLNENSKRSLRLFVFTATLASLIKAISAIVFIIVLCLLILDRLNLFKTLNKGKLIEEPLQLFKAILLGLSVVFVWYAYASWLSKHYDNESFALKPLMVSEWGVFKEIIETIKNLWYSHYYSYEGYVLFGASAILLLIFAKFANKVLLSITILYFLGLVCYAYLFLYQFKWHDYYIIAVLPLVFFVLLTMGELIMRISDKYFSPLQLIVAIVLIFNLKESMKYCKKSYTERNTRAIYYWTGDYRAYEDLEPKLRKAGIDRTDKFISAFDETYCSSLYLIDQIGINIGSETSVKEIDGHVKNSNFKYLILNDSARFNKVYPNNFADKIVLYHRGLIIYKLH